MSSIDDNIDENLHIISRRGEDWLDFTAKVFEHLEGYTVPQYGDKGDDIITNYSIEQCLAGAEKYIKRYGKNQREGQQELDFLKMAHYIQCAYEKYVNQPKSHTNTISFSAKRVVDARDDMLKYLEESVYCTNYNNVKITLEVT